METQTIATPNDDIKRLEDSFIALTDAFRQHQQFIKGEYNISPLEMELIRFVTKNSKQKMKDIAKYFNIKLSTLTSVIDKAEKQRIIKRVNSKEDRRVVYIETTRKGKNIYNKYLEYLRGVAQKMKENLEEDNFSVFVGGFERLFEVQPDVEP